MPKKFIIFILSVTAAAEVLADSPACKAVSSSNDILRCAQENHPSIRESIAQTEAAKELREAGGQIPNPSLQFEFVRSHDYDDTVFEREIRLSQEIELGGKRGARIERAEAQLDVSQSNQAKKLEDVTVQTVLILYRLKQIEEELEVLEEALTTYGRAQKQYRNRQSLSPEHKVSLTVFELAESDHRLQQQALIDEQRKLKNAISISTGLDAEVIFKHLPDHKENWPSLDVHPSSDLSMSADISLAQSNLKLADAELEFQRSQSWPNLTVTPIYQQNREGGANFGAFGLNLSIPLPLWNVNGGGRAYAHRTKATAEIILNNQRTRVRVRRQEQLEIYKSAIKVISESRSHRSVEAKHKNVERLFKRGLVSSPLVIEAHRQISDFLRRYHEYELKALSALWTVFAIDGDLKKKEL